MTKAKSRRQNRVRPDRKPKDRLTRPHPEKGGAYIRQPDGTLIPEATAETAKPQTAKPQTADTKKGD